METGGNIPGTSAPCYTIKASCTPPMPVLIAVPHGGRSYPAEILAEMRDPDFSTLRLEDRLIDVLGAEIAQATGATLLTAQAPRAMLDLNRAREDVDWDMISGPKPHPIRHSQANRRARSGLGLIPRRLPGFGEIWRTKLSRASLDQRIEGIHQPYHGALGRELDAIRDEWGSALLIDLHSMPPLKPNRETGEVAKFVIGDRFGTSCDAGIVAHAYHSLLQKGYSVAHNRPYAGGYVLDSHSSPRHGIHAIQLEICRSTYLDARFEQLAPKSAAIVKLLASLVRDLGAMTAQLTSRDELQNAAE